MSRLYGRLRDLIVHASDMCLPVPRRQALRFRSHLRFKIY
jgi:hypothetical protein